MRNASLAIVTCAALALAGCASHQVQPVAATPEARPPSGAAALSAAQPAVALPPAPAQATQAEVLTRPQIESQLLNLINQERAHNGLKPLTISAELERSAEAHAAEMAKDRFVSVRGSDEPSLADRFDQAGVRSDSVGENVVSLPISDAYLAGESVKTWLAKDAARRNLLSPRFERTGFGIERSPGAVGEAYVTADFAH